MTPVDSIKDVVRSSKFRQTTEEGRRTYRPKRCGDSNKDQDNSPKTLNDKNHEASSQNFFLFVDVCSKLYNSKLSFLL